MHVVYLRAEVNFMEDESKLSSQAFQSLNDVSHDDNGLAVFVDGFLSSAPPVPLTRNAVERLLRRNEPDHYQKWAQMSIVQALGKLFISSFLFFN